ncbi:MAG: peptidase, partial [Verrucomicrobiota bacterium]
MSRPGLLTVLALCGATLAHAVAPSFTAIAPAGGQRGTTVEVTLRGERLTDAQELFFYHPGITVEKISEATDKQVKATLVIAPDC